MMMVTVERVEMVGVLLIGVPATIVIVIVMMVDGIALIGAIVTVIVAMVLVDIVVDSAMLMVMTK